MALVRGLVAGLVVSGSIGSACESIYRMCATVGKVHSRLASAGDIRVGVRVLVTSLRCSVCRRMQSAAWHGVYGIAVCCMYGNSGV